MGDFPKVRSSSLDEPGIELLSWAVANPELKLPARQVSFSAEGESGRGAQLLRWGASRT